VRIERIWRRRRQASEATRAFSVNQRVPAPGVSGGDRRLRDDSAARRRRWRCRRHDGVGVLRGGRGGGGCGTDRARGGGAVTIGGVVTAPGAEVSPTNGTATRWWGGGSAIFVEART
jgi:hypothetical protein